MGVLDDLRTKAQDRREQEEADAALAAEREQFYRDEIEPRMTQAYQFFMELVDHLNYVKPETLVNYPLLPDGMPAALRQSGYTVVIDSSKALKRIDINCQCSLEKPLEFEIFGKDAVLRHSDRLDRFYIKYERRDYKDTNYELIGAKFKIEGPLPLKIVINADIMNSVILLGARNFTGSGVTRYTVQPAEFDEAFMDRIGQFMLREIDKLFTLEMDENAKEAIRERLRVEAEQREQEMREAEERLKAEEAGRLASSRKEQIKQTVRKTVDENKERLKDLFSKIKSPTGQDSKPKT